MARALVATTTLVLGGCGRPATPEPPAPSRGPEAVGVERVAAERVVAVRELVTALAHDSMEGRRTGSPGSERAAALIADEMLEIGLVAAGNGGDGGAADARRNAYLQRVPLARIRTADGRERLTLITGDTDTIPDERLVTDANVIGLIPGTDPALRDEAVVVGAHFDHVGIGAPMDGDSIRNGADDDASGVVAMLEIARSLRQGPPPKRTVVLIAFTGEEMGGLGNRHYLANPVVPLERTVAQLQIEMIGRPDPLAGGAGRAWLTGHERSTMGDMLRDNGIPIVPDPRPDQNFFRRSDNYAFALRGIPAHTLSSFNLHTDYHQPSDEADTIDFDHMTAVIEAATRAVRILADGTRPQWKPGGRPER